MKGIIFTIFNKMIEEKFGLKTWDELIDAVNPESKGAYTAPGTYDDKELFGLVGKLSEKTKVGSDRLVYAFGEYLFKQLAARYPNFTQKKTLKDFLLSVDKVIHVEVRKFYPDAGLPSFTYDDLAHDELVMIYESPRKLCKLAEGLISGASKHFNTSVVLTHETCMHSGAKNCRLHLKFGGSNND